MGVRVDQEGYKKALRAVLYFIGREFPADAEDILHDILVWQLEHPEVNIRLPLAVMNHAYKYRRERRCVAVGLDVRRLADAIDLAEQAERSRIQRLAQRVLNQNELDSLLNDYGVMSSNGIKLTRRKARNKLRAAWPKPTREPSIAFVIDGARRPWQEAA